MMFRFHMGFGKEMYRLMIYESSHCYEGSVRYDVQKWDDSFKEWESVGGISQCMLLDEALSRGMNNLRAAVQHSIERQRAGYSQYFVPD